MAPPIVEGVETILGDDLPKARVIVTAASGRRFTQRVAEELAREERLVIICGHYEGIDARVTELLHAEEYSIGDYVLTGGELPAMVMIDAIGRLLPGVIQAASIEEESHSESLVEYPHYTRPVTYRDLDVPPILLSGHHAKIAAWRREQAIERTKERRPELLDLEDE
jgi:tRNA (guanine37-N1)-methyltransferase